MPRHPPCALCILTFWYSLSQYIALYWALSFFLFDIFRYLLDVWLDHIWSIIVTMCSFQGTYSVKILFKDFHLLTGWTVIPYAEHSTHRMAIQPFLSIWQPPTLPYRLQYSTIGRSGLNHRVRDVYGCDPWPHRHQKLWTLGEVFSNLVWTFSFSLNEVLSSLVKRRYLFVTRTHFVSLVKSFWT